MQIFVPKVLNDKVPIPLKDNSLFRLEKEIATTKIRNSTCRWQTQTFSNKIFYQRSKLGILLRQILETE